MSDRPSTPGKVCPTCGTRLSEDATKCVVCGADLSTTSTAGKNQDKGVQGSRMPEITLSLPIALILLAVILGLGAVLVFFVLRSSGRVVEPTPTVTVTLTATATITPTPVTPTLTNTPEPTATPVTYTVNSGDTCIGIALSFGVSVQSIVLLNNLPADCGSLAVGQAILIPQPTPTPTSPPTATLSASEATEAACEKVSYIVQDGDTLSGIARFYDIPIAEIRSYNGLTSDQVYSGQPLEIPLCARAPTPGPSPTPTPPPPYSAPNLLLPADGTTFPGTDATISLQWASVGALNPNESYLISVIDVTSGENNRVVETTTDTSFQVPRSLRPTDGVVHIFRWTVSTVRQVGTDDNGNPIFDPAGATSNPRVFSWASGTAPAAATPTP
jgi:LysM repeat protein